MRPQARLRSTASSPDKLYREVRALTEALAAPLSDADATLQSMEDASPAKWHLAHTSWFFETFLLREHLPGYRRFGETWPFLFNSYYEAEGERIARGARGMLSRPSLDEVLSYRSFVDEAMSDLLERPDCAALIELGLAHEQQHQELLLTDIKHALFQNPLGPAMWPAGLRAQPSAVPARSPGTDPSAAAASEDRASRGLGLVPPDTRQERGWQGHPGGTVSVGAAGPGFCFDCEGPRHEVLLQPFELAARLVTNAEWACFVADGGYRTASLWLSDGWAWVQRDAIGAPLYWRGDDHFTHSGWQARDPAAPVAHVSCYEADAYAHWAGARLPTEFEWEASAGLADPAGGNQLDEAGPPFARGGAQMFGDVWQWTRSAYLPYPRFRPAAGAIGEYNGKFMSGQFVLKGASCATPRGHSRASYRNFFYPHQRWQFTGLRLARDC